MTRYEQAKPVKESYVRFVPGEQDTFWGKAEALVLAALENYARHASNGQGLARRLFADDAARGFALIDLCRRRFDAVLMNPPFGESSKPSKPYIEKAFSRTKNDVYAAFVERGLDLLKPRGLLGTITSRTGFFLTSFQKWREDLLLGEARPTTFADLGYGVLDAAMVETAAYCLEETPRPGEAVFIRLLSQGEKAAGLAKAIESVRDGRDVERVVYIVDTRSFRQVPGSPFAYWVSEQIRSLFPKYSQFEGEGRTVKQGLATADDFRFVRTAWEVDPNRRIAGTSQTTPEQIRRLTWEEKRWATFAKGGEYAPYYADVHLAVNWERDGKEIREFIDQETGRTFSRPQGIEYYFRRGLTWPRRSTSGFGLRILPGGCIFAD
jgi:hypothetical protein